ncbi:leucine-rich melanocyte differentiation-associated protein [Parasteatoda tepidariorum]|nr:leucine-rich melanocyte differentiation-associated protein [Parasteatoda tepidariorum]
MTTNFTTNVEIITSDGVVKTLIVDQERKITGAYQNFRNIPGALVACYGQWVEVLDLSHNKLRDVRRLRSMTQLQTLILDHNLIVSTTLFPKLLNLKVLSLNYNLISDIQLFIPPLARACPNIQHLSLMGNLASVSSVAPTSEKEQEEYRNFVVSHFEHLQHLDDQPVSTLERVRNEKRELTLKEKFLNEISDIKTACEIRLQRSLSSTIV